jgi:hypothetical protein
VVVAPQIVMAENGGEFVEINVQRDEEKQKAQHTPSIPVCFASLRIMVERREIGKKGKLRYTRYLWTKQA